MSKVQKNFLIAGVSLAIALLSSVPARAVLINLELYNSFGLIDEASVPLQGTAASGDVVQFILAGANGAIDAPSLSGGVGGDDTLLFTTHVGAGMLPIDYNAGLLDVFPITLNLAVGTNVYVRFWNAATLGSATYYGNSALTNLPAPDTFNYAALDFVPSAGSPRQTDQPFAALSIPEPSGVFLFGLAVVAVARRFHRPRKSSGVS
jgi:hypothetical protein